MPTQLVLIVATVAGLLTGGLYLSVMGGPAFILLQYLTQLPLFLVGFSLGFVPALMSNSSLANEALRSPGEPISPEATSSPGPVLCFQR